LYLRGSLEMGKNTTHDLDHMSWDNVGNLAHEYNTNPWYHTDFLDSLEVVEVDKAFQYSNRIEVGQGGIRQSIVHTIHKGDKWGSQEEQVQYTRFQ